MSAAEEPLPEPPPGQIGPATGEGIWTLGLYDEGDLVANAGSLADARVTVSRIVLDAQKTLSPGLAARVADTWGVVEQSWGAGEIDYTATPDFFRWLRYAKGVPLVTAGLVASGVLAGYLLEYATAHGYRPPVLGPPISPAELARLTEGQRAVRSAAGAVRPQEVTAPGLTKPEAAAISKAIGVSYADSLRALAAVVDRMLPGMAPGQVPQALTQLDTATTVLERQVHALAREVQAGGKGSLAGTVSGLGHTLMVLQAAVATLEAQLAVTEPSALLAEVESLHTAQEATTARLDHVGKVLPDLATTAALTALTAKVAVTVEDLSLRHASALDTALNGVEARVADLARQAADDALCCEANSAVTNPIKAGGATPSLLRQLGGLLGKAFEIGFIATLAETALAVLDLPLAVSGVVADTATISRWAIEAAGVIEADLSWQGKLTGG